MPLYKWDGKKFIPLNEIIFQQERDFEAILASTPTLYLNNERLLIISRQTGKSQIFDLLALDSKGNCVIIELKKGKLPRRAIAQILEYAASVSKLSYADLDKLAREWFTANGREYTSLFDIHSRLFEYELGALQESSFNAKQRLVLVSAGADARVLEVAEYLRSCGVDVTFVSYSTYGTKDEVIVTMESSGKYSVISEKKKQIYTTGQRLTREIFLNTLSENKHLRETAAEFFKYLDDCGASFRNRVGWLRMTIGGKWWVDAYPAKRCTHFRVNAHGDFTSEQIREYISTLPAATAKKFGLSFNITNKSDWEYARRIFENTHNAILEA